jgi:predicted nicotinamide N-methyase
MQTRLDAAFTRRRLCPCPAGAAHSEEDPYGVVLWPAAQATAQALMEHAAAGAGPAALLGAGDRFLELGAGTGLCSLAAASAGASAYATDYRAEPLQLIDQVVPVNSARLARTLDVRTGILDICGPAALPPTDVLAAADVLYFRATGVALAGRCVEALRAGARLVVVGDCGRPGRGAFLEELAARGVHAEAVKFRDVGGWSAGTARNDLIAPDDSEAGPRPATIGLLTLTPADLLPLRREERGSVP